MVEPTLNYDEMLYYLKKIEFVLYAPGAGGDFWSSLISSAYIPNKPIMQPDSGQQIIYNSYGNYKATSAPKYIANITEHVLAIAHMPHFVKADVVEQYKTVISTGLLTQFWGVAKTLQRLPADKVMMLLGEDHYKDKILIFPNHMLSCDYPWPEEWINSLVKSDLFKTLNIMPQTELGWKVFKQRHINLWEWFYNPNKYRNIYVNGKTFFSYYDYIVVEDYDSIINFINDHYGPEFRWEYVRKQLERYYAIVIAPIIKGGNYAKSTYY